MGIRYYWQKFMFKFKIYFQNAGMTYSAVWSDVEA